MTDDTELQSTVARVLAREPEPGGIGDLHAEIAVLRSRLREAVEALRPFAAMYNPVLKDVHGAYAYQRAAALVARHDTVRGEEWKDGR